MAIESWLSLIVFSIATGAFLLKSERSCSLRLARVLFFFSVPAVFAVSFYSVFAQYQNWQGGALSQFFLPPHRSINYFLVDVGDKIFAPWLIALLAAIIIPRAALRLNRKYGERFFHNEEFWLMRLGIFLTGYPGFLFYLIFVLSAGVLLSAFYFLFSRGRAPLYYFWMPAGILTVILLYWFFPEEIIKQFAL